MTTEEFRQAFEEAKLLLSTCKRETLGDQSFGDYEVYWTLGAGEATEEVAVGYFSTTTSGVTMTKSHVNFTGEWADELRNCCQTSSYQRNDG
jgi:hypothetical protein